MYGTYSIFPREIRIKQIKNEHQNRLYSSFVHDDVGNFVFKFLDRGLKSPLLNVLCAWLLYYLGEKVYDKFWKKDEFELTI